MDFPSRQDIDRAVQNLQHFIEDPQLIDGEPIWQFHRLVKYSGGYSMVYPINTATQKYALRCWYSDIGDAKFRYLEIDRYLKQVNLPYFVDFNFIENGIRVNNQHWDIIRMEWADALPLKEYLEDHLSEPDTIRALAESFLTMVTSFHQVSIAHGDLQHGNILVDADGQILLVDYDSLFVPALDGELDLIKGLEGYQHPQRFTPDTTAHAKLDYFSELVIYLSLLALVEDPGLWYRYQLEDSEDLLFNRQDFNQPSFAQIFTELSAMSPLIQELSAELIEFCEATYLEDLEPLEEIISKVLTRLLPPAPPVDGKLAAEELIQRFQNLVIAQPDYKIQEAANSIILKMNNN